MEEFVERRGRVRTPFITDAVISCDSVTLRTAVDLVNISISGMYVETDTSIAADSICDIRIVIRGKHSRLILDDIQGVVIRNDEKGFAVKFTSDMEWFVLFKIYTRYVKEGRS